MLTVKDESMKKVLITGGTRGIGKGIALAFQKKNYDVYAVYEKNAFAAAELEKLGIKTLCADVSKEEDVKRVFSIVGDVDILVNNAGVSLIKQVQDVTYNEWQRVFSVNVGGAFLCTREAVKGMISKKSGLIVNISSVWGEVGASCESVYASSKAALHGFTKSLAKELGYSGIRVNTVSPGVIDTDMNAHFTSEEKAGLKEEIPVGRFGLSEEVAHAVLFLEENAYVTGVDIPVNGGFSVC